MRQELQKVNILKMIKMQKTFFLFKRTLANMFGKTNIFFRLKGPAEDCRRKRFSGLFSQFYIFFCKLICVKDKLRHKAKSALSSLQISLKCLIQILHFCICTCLMHVCDSISHYVSWSSPLSLYLSICFLVSPSISPKRFCYLSLHFSVE